MIILMISGKQGSGKTTISNMLSKKLSCADTLVSEIDTLFEHKE